SHQFLLYIFSALFCSSSSVRFFFLFTLRPSPRLTLFPYTTLFRSGCELMLLDEPYLGLDVEKRQVFYDVLREEHGRTIVISTHHLNELSGHLDTVLMLNGMKHGAVAELIDGILEVTGHPENIDRLLN